MWSHNKFEGDKELSQNFGGKTSLFTRKAQKLFEISIKEVYSKKMR
jgi:hypothetical protein